MFYVLESERLKMISTILYEGDDGWGRSFLKGVEIDPPKTPEKLFVYAECPHRSLPDYFETGCVPIVNQKVVDVIKSIDIKNIQILPAQIRFEDKIVTGYNVLNIVGIIPFIDVNASKCSKMESLIVRMGSLKYKPDHVGELDMFRATEYQSVIFISERIKQAFEDYQLSGCLLTPAEGWGDSHRF